MAKLHRSSRELATYVDPRAGWTHGPDDLPKGMKIVNRQVKRGWRSWKQLRRAQPIRRLLAPARSRRLQDKLIKRTWKRYGKPDGLFSLNRRLRMSDVPPQTFRRLGFLRKAAGFSTGRAIRYAAPVVLAAGGYGAYRGAKALRKHFRKPKEQRRARYMGALSGLGTGALGGAYVGLRMASAGMPRAGLGAALLSAAAGAAGGWRHGNREWKATGRRAARAIASASGRKPRSRKAHVFFMTPN